MSLTILIKKQHLELQ